MGMRISGSGNQNEAQGVGAASWQQRQQSVKDLMSALQSGDLGAAQKAFGSLPGAANISSSDSNSPLAQIGKALQSGDLEGAQKAAQALQAKRSGGHHHHSDVAATPPTGAASQPAPAGTGTIVNLTA